MGYKWCAVPKCTNTSVKTPEKLFVSVPKNVKVRRKWLQLSRRAPNDIANSTNIFFCEDHFDMENDMANYYQYKMGFSQKIILKDKTLPSKFQCQPDHNKRMHEACAKELSQKCDKSTLTIPVETVEKSVQCNFINNVHIRSKAMQTKTATRDTGTSSLKPTVASSCTSPLWS